MAKSIYDILDDLKTSTSVKNHGQVDHTLPRNLFPTAEQFESEELLLAWAQENNILHAVLQKGIQKFLIELRATFKSCKKDDVWTPDYGQNNVNEMEWTITNRPNQAGTKVAAQAKLEAGIEMAQAMKAAKLADKTIQISLIPVYGEDVTQTIMDVINSSDE